MPATAHIDKLVFTFTTADEDLRGGDANLDITVQFRDGHAQRVTNANDGMCWSQESTHEVVVPLDAPATPDDIARIDLTTTFRSGAAGDHWSMRSMALRAEGEGMGAQLLTHGYGRFTGEVDLFALPVAARVG